MLMFYYHGSPRIKKAIKLILLGNKQLRTQALSHRGKSLDPHTERGIEPGDEAIVQVDSNKVLDTFTMIRLHHAKHNYLFCNQIGALKFESGSVPRDKNITQNTKTSLYTHSYVKVAMRLLWEYTFSLQEQFSLKMATFQHCC